MTDQVADGVQRVGSRAHNFYVLIDGVRVTVVDTSIGSADG